MGEAYERMKAAEQKIKDAHAELREVARDAIVEFFSELASQYGPFWATWNQYTDYFNDGNPCEFGVHDIWTYTGGLDEVKSKWAWLGWDKEEIPEEVDGVEEANIPVTAWSGQPKDIVFEHAFGDHTQVLLEASPSGCTLTIESYDEHD